MNIIDPKLIEKDSLLPEDENDVGLKKPHEFKKNESYEPRKHEHEQNLKNQLFAREYFKNGLNAKEAMKVVNPNLEGNSLNSMASGMLRKPEVLKILYSLLPSVEEDVSLIQKAYAAKLPQNIAFKDVYKYLELSMKLKGLIDDKKDQTDVKIGLVIEN
jgi:hypothetical protein